MKINQFISSRRPRPLRSAKYAVVFYATTRAEALRPLALAYALLRFVDENIRNADYHRFNMIAVTYRFTERGVVGVMFFDAAFRFAYSRAISSALLESDGFMSSENDNFPILTWNSPQQLLTNNLPYPWRSLIPRLITVARYDSKLLIHEFY